MVVALGLLGGIILSMAGLVVLGNRQVYSGRSSSKATTLTSAVLEDIGTWGFTQTYATFGCLPDAADCDVGSVNPTHDRFAAWRAAAAEDLGNGDLNVLIEPIGAAELGLATALRVKVRIDWNEGPRLRSMELVRVRS